MADMWTAVILPCLVCLTGLAQEAAGGEYCWDYDHFGTTVQYCRYGCCGTLQDECCSIPIGIIIGAVIGGLVFVAVVITIVCCFVKKQGHRGRVMGHAGPMGGNNVTVVHATTTSAPGYMAPQGYGPPPPYNPGNLYNNAAYGPPPTFSTTTTASAYPPGTAQGFAAPANPGYAPPDGPRGF